MGPLLVSLLVAPAFAETGTPLTVTVRLRSDAPEAMTLQLPEDDVCLALQQLRMVLTNPAGKEQKAAPCTNEARVAVTLAPGESFERTLSLAKIFPAVKWSTGRWALDQSWARPPDAGIPGGQVSMTAEPLIRAKAVQTFTIKRGASVTLSDGSTFRFRAHGHKDVEAGQSSPLIVRGSFAGPGKKLQEFDANVMMEEDRILDLDGHVFELLDAKYDDSMKLKYFGRVKRDE